MELTSISEGKANISQDTQGQVIESRGEHYWRTLAQQKPIFLTFKPFKNITFKDVLLLNLEMIAIDAYQCFNITLL
jgi:hypothetical protein